MSERLKRWQREEVYQISHDWVQDYCLHRITERDMELGRLLAKRKLIRRDQIPTLHPGFRNLANPEVQINRRLRVLFDSHFIDRAFPRVPIGGGSSQAIISLDRAGAILLGVSPFKRIIRHEKDKNGNITRVLPIDYRHTLGINDFEVALTNHCLKSEFEILRWRIDFENVRRFQFNGEHTIRPDGFGIVRLPNGKGRAFFFEYDTGSEDKRDRKRFKTLRAKFKTYAAYKASGAWTQEDWAKKLREFPSLIFLTEDKRRIAPLQELTSTIKSVNIIVDHFENRHDAICNLMKF